MRVTQSMMASSSLRHLHQSYQSLTNLQDQLATGKKITRASQDPVIAMNGMRYRTQVAETDQFKRNLSEVYNWMDTSDATLDQGTQALHRVRELTVQASNDSYDSGQRANIAKEVDQLLEQLLSISNTKNNNKYIFNGTNTTNAPVDQSRMDYGVTQIAEGADIDAADVDLIFRGATYHALEEVPDDLPEQVREQLLNDGSIIEDPDNPGEYVINTGDNRQLFQHTASNRSDQVIAINQSDGIPNNDRIRQYALSRNENGDLVNSQGERVNDPADADVNNARRIPENQAVISLKDAVSTNQENVNIEILKGVKLPVNVDPKNVFTNELFGDMIALREALEDPSTSAGDLSEMLDVIDHHINNFVDERAELGARVNRVEMVDQRVQQQQVIAQRIMSDNEDAEMERVITEMLSQENVHRAALSATGRIIQPTLMDFLR
ncbi:flagellar hook-associated protein 3 [[Bacillus] selenitireducens MLS10]|uniref:Flagellar hook-associated protein 3 n=1 Tax=Bacillus selenitireducens (strain ATCC 700615 / DSM 15326 / MLS10) TaxID=439292 RepID=D6Y0F7_BACIE|nr:flagellar hook-associated protein 3 [[Bacillus] selenitireducens MLS10]